MAHMSIVPQWLWQPWYKSRCYGLHHTTGSDTNFKANYRAYVCVHVCN